MKTKKDGYRMGVGRTLQTKEIAHKTLAVIKESMCEQRTERIVWLDSRE